MKAMFCIVGAQVFNALHIVVGTEPFGHLFIVGRRISLGRRVFLFFGFFIVILLIDLFVVAFPCALFFLLTFDESKHGGKKRGQVCVLG